MKTLGILGCFALVSSNLVACGGASAETPEERIGAVQSALSKPTGKLDATSAKLAISRSQASTDLQGFVGFVSGVPGMGGVATGGCVSGGSSDGSVDLKCSSQGAASGSATYSVKTAAGPSGDTAFVSVTFTKACQGTTCIDGTIVVSTQASAAGASVIMDADVEWTRSGATEHTHVGLSVSTGASGSKLDLVVFDDAGGSYILDASVSASGSQWSLQGANGSFSCQSDSGGTKGSCMGSSSFSW